MRKPLPLLFSIPLLLAACSQAPTVSSSVQNQIINPLYANQYWSSLIDRMVDIEIKEPAMVKDATIDAVIRQTKTDAQAHVETALKQIRQGIMGSFVPVKEQPVGHALLLNHVLYIGPDFLTDPGPALHLYLTKMADPTHGTFPDKTAIDLGLIATPFGSQSYDLTGKNTDDLKNLVLYDTALQRMYGLAHLGH